MARRRPVGITSKLCTLGAALHNPASRHREGELWSADAAAAPTSKKCLQFQKGILKAYHAAVQAEARAASGGVAAAPCGGHRVLTCAPYVRVAPAALFDHWEQVLSCSSQYFKEAAVWLRRKRLALVEQLQHPRVQRISDRIVKCGSV